MERTGREHGEKLAAIGTEQLTFLDGIRGLMAINVLLCHFVCVYFPQMYFLDYAERVGGVASLFAWTPLSVFVNGNIAVQYFFVLTGFLVGKSVFTKTYTNRTVVRKSANRYLRLLPIVFFSTLFTFLTMKLGLQKHLEITNLVANKTFLLDYCNFDATIPFFLLNAFVDTFLFGNNFVGPFWTIAYEFLGYIFALVISYLLKENPWRKLGYLIIGFVCAVRFGTNYLAFVIGLVMADFLYNMNEDKLAFLYTKWMHSRWFLGLCLVLGCYFACCPLSYTSIYAILGHIPGVEPGFYRAVGAALLIYTFMHMPKVQAVLSGKWLLALGNISFEVYAIHWPIMLTWQAWLFSVLIDKMEYTTAALSAFIATIPVIYGAAYLMHRFISENKYIQRLRIKE